MQLKRYQEQVIREVKLFLEALATQQASRNRHPSLDAWDETRQNSFIKTDYRSRKNGLRKDLPTFCIKVPTGGGKTLLAT